MHLDFQTPDQVAEQLLHASADPAPLWLLLVADVHGDDLPDLLEACRRRGLRVCGGLFPGLIQAERPLHRGLIARPLAVGALLARAQLDSEGMIWLSPPPGLLDESSALLLVDCLAPGISRLLEDLYDRYGNRLVYAGAGAGYHDLRPAPALFTEQGLLERGALLLLIPRRATVRVRHGWERVSGPFVASRTCGNVIQELNWEPAGGFYRRLVAEQDANYAGRPVFPDLGAAFPLCIGKEGGEDVMRDPMGETAEGAIAALSDVAENSVMYLSHGNSDSLLAAARQAVEACGAPADVSACFVSDCYSRVLMLGEDFPRELAAIHQALQRFTEVVPEGVMALGEICANGENSLEFFNKTVVIALQHASIHE